MDPLAIVTDVEAITGELVDDDDVSRVSRLIEMASAAVRTFTAQTLSLVEGDQVWVPSSGTSLLVLPERPVLDVTAVEVEWGEALFTWDAFGRLRRLDGLEWGRTNAPVWVTYSHGYDPIPADVVGLVAGKVANHLTGVAGNPGGLRALQVGAMSETYGNAVGTPAAVGPMALSKDEKEVLRPYRLGAMSLSVSEP